MTIEEIKKELLENEQQQTNIIINSQFMALYTQLIKKGVFAQKDIDEMNEFTKEYIEKLNDKVANEIFRRIEEEENE